jgi:hypothetical protein
VIRDYAIGSFRLPLLQLLQRAAVASLSLAWGLASADPAQAGCRFKLEAESGRQMAVAAAQPLYQNGQTQFRISRGTSGAELQVRFKPGGKPRFSPSEVIRQLNEVQAGAELISSASRNRFAE